MSQTTVETFFTTRKRRTAITEYKNEGKSGGISKKVYSKTLQNAESEKVQTAKAKVDNFKDKPVTKTKSVEKTVKVKENKLSSLKDEANAEPTEISKVPANVKKTDVKLKTAKPISSKQTQSSSKTAQKSKSSKVHAKKKESSKVKNQKLTDFYTPSKLESDCTDQILINKKADVDPKHSQSNLTDNKLESENVAKTNQVEALTPKKTSTLTKAVQSPKRKLPPPNDVTPSKKQAVLEDDGKVSYVPITPSKDGVSSARKKLDMDSMTKNLPVDSLKFVTPTKSPKLGKLDNMIEQSRSKLILSPKMDQFRKSLSSFNEKASKVQERLSNPFKVTCIAKSGLSPSKKQVVLTSKTASEEFSSFKDPTFHQELILPRKFKLLSELFKSLETVITMLNNRKERAVFNKVKEGVQKIVKRTFTKIHLGQIMAVYPEAYNVTVEKCSYITKTADSPDYQYVITPVLQKAGKGKKQQPMTPQCILERFHTFNENLLVKVKNHHQKFLDSIHFKLSSDKEIKRWHPEFIVDGVPDVQPVDLPEPEENKTYTAKDVLNKIKSSFRTKSKKVESALQSVVGPSIEETKVKKDAENIKTKSRSEAVGICPSLLAKIRAKETAKNLEKMTQTPLEREMIAMRERLPHIIKIIWHYFVAEKKKVILLAEIIEKIKDSLGSHITHDAVKRHLNLVEKEYNGWLQFIELERGTYVRIDKARDINRMVDL